ncbi:hypothetical protein [Stenotrophomonas sp. NLF4-10]|uniref:hypothetical protein n=1 Tax=Stenotrophomonas sp. NLF4-10 TaxID=2918754 RepID=UPI001EFB0AA9|nr:hypothetical protein [Stenotrophomonas sp. NLF4-10]MCG8277305.1 hypothetical protein [Stenotrophomonas sp. NLF4-10]
MKFRKVHAASAARLGFCQASEHGYGMGLATRLCANEMALSLLFDFKLAEVRNGAGIHAMHLQ